MKKHILVLSGSPKSRGNTSQLIEWFTEGTRDADCDVEIFHVGSPSFNTEGCRSCRVCQKKEEFVCTIEDDAKPVLRKMADADVIVMATPLYFFGPSGQLKCVIDRMFSLYKWDNEAGTMETPLKGKSLILIGSAFEDVGLDALEMPFKLTADYTSMQFRSLLIPHAGVSGDLEDRDDIKEQTVKFAQEVMGL